ncbi:MAG: hypothetical protein WCK77_14725, partial [Verrucomicrobiota bacterium]
QARHQTRHQKTRYRRHGLLSGQYSAGRLFSDQSTLSQQYWAARPCANAGASATVRSILLFSSVRRSIFNVRRSRFQRRSSLPIQNPKFNLASDHASLGCAGFLQAR